MDDLRIAYVWNVTATVRHRQSGAEIQRTRNVLGSTPKDAVLMFDSENVKWYRVSQAVTVCLRVAMVVVNGRGLPKIERDKYPIYQE